MVHIDVHEESRGGEGGEERERGGCKMMGPRPQNRGGDTNEMTTHTRIVSTRLSRKTRAPQLGSCVHSKTLVDTETATLTVMATSFSTSSRCPA